MLITAGIIAAVAAVHYTTAMVTAIAVGSASIGGFAVGLGFYYLREPAHNEEDTQELIRLRGELIRRNDRLREEASATLEHTQTNARAIANTTSHLHGHITTSTQIFEKEVAITAETNLQLLDMVTLLKKVADSTTTEVHPIIEEIQSRLQQIDITNSTLKSTCIRLDETEKLLEESVKKHAIAQEKLDATIEENSLHIMQLTMQLKEARALVNPDTEVINTTKHALDALQTENRKLIAKISELETNLNKLALELSTVTTTREIQAGKMKTLLTMNKQLTAQVNQLNDELEERDKDMAKNSSRGRHSPTLFATYS